MNNENKIDLSIEMYEDLKETLVKTIKNAKAGGAGNAGLDNVQLERMERLIEAAERSQGQVTQLLRTPDLLLIPDKRRQPRKGLPWRYPMLLTRC